MNTATKVLTILNLILAVTFLVSAMMLYAVGENWKRRWVMDTNKLVGQNKTLKDEVKKESLDRAIAEAALASSTQQIQSLSAENDRLLSDNKTKEEELAAKELTIAQQNDRILAQNERITDLEESLRLARKRASELNHIAQVARAVAFQLNVKLSEVEDDVNNLHTDLTKANESIHKMEASMERKDAQLALVKRDYPEVHRYITGDEVKDSRVITGVVAAVRIDPATNEQHLVMLTVGGDEKVQEGTEFVIYRGDKYVVKVRAQKVFPDMVACVIDPKSWNKEGLKVELADAAQNRLFY